MTGLIYAIIPFPLSSAYTFVYISLIHICISIYISHISTFTFNSISLHFPIVYCFLAFSLLQYKSLFTLNHSIFLILATASLLSCNPYINASFWFNFICPPLFTLLSSHQLCSHLSHTHSLVSLSVILLHAHSLFVSSVSYSFLFGYIFPLITIFPLSPHIQNLFSFYPSVLKYFFSSKWRADIFLFSRTLILPIIHSSFFSLPLSPSFKHFIYFFCILS